MVRVQIWVICVGDHFFRARDRVGDLASLSKRDNDVAERAMAQPGELNRG